MATPPARGEARRARAKTTLRYCRMVRNCSRLRRIERLVTDGDDRQIDRVPDRIAQREMVARRAHFARRRHVQAFRASKDETAEHAPDRLAETLGGVLRGGAGFGKAAVPCGRSAQRVGRQAMDRRRGEHGGRDNEQEDQQTVVGTAAFRDRRDRQPWNLRLHRHTGAGHRQRDGFQRIDHGAGEDPGRQA